MIRRVVPYLVIGISLLMDLNARELVPWPEKDYNPRPANGDFTLPMPCGGAMVFRKIEVPASGWLGDRRVVLGASDERFQIMENTRFAYVAGSFTETNDFARRFYYLGKYEVTQMQYDVVRDKCETARPQGRLPASQVSWFDAVRFSHVYTEWLLRVSPNSLPKEDGQPGFIRLPTEAEWEFAVRGGLAVSESEFEQKTFPVPEGMHKYVWFQGTKSANGKPQFTGLLAPNPLILHDMLGNLDEVVLEPFRLNRVSRLHGQVGGFVVKGGNYLTSEGDIRSAYRQEIPHFDHDGPNRVMTIGFRVAISAPIITSRGRLEAIKTEWQALPRSQPLVSTSQPEDTAGDPVQELEALRSYFSEIDQQLQLDKVALVLRANITERNEQRDRATKSMLRLGAFLGQKIRDDRKRLSAARSILEGRKKAGSDLSAVQRLEDTLRGAEVAMKENLDYYKDVVLQVGQEYTEGVIDRQYSKLVAEFENRQLRGLIPFASSFAACVSAYRKSGTVELQGCIPELMN